MDAVMIVTILIIKYEDKLFGLLLIWPMLFFYKACVYSYCDWFYIHQVYFVALIGLMEYYNKWMNEWVDIYVWMSVGDVDL
jgi:hypothetical protein